MVNMPPKIAPGKADADDKKKEESKDPKDKNSAPSKWNKAVKKVSNVTKNEKQIIKFLLKIFALKKLCICTVYVRYMYY